MHTKPIEAFRKEFKKRFMTGLFIVGIVFILIGLLFYVVS